MLVAASTVCPSGRPPVRAPRRRFDTISRDDMQRAAAEAFVAGVYRRHYGARVAHWAPTLVTLCTDGRIAAAAGYREAHEPLYLEHYLDVPVERAIAARTGESVDRRDIVEVGHFASRQPGEGRRLLVLLAQHLAQAGCRWVVSTATSEVRELLVRVGLTPLALAPADPARLPGGATRWGRYYEHSPLVVAGDLPRSLAILERRGKA